MGLYPHRSHSNRDRTSSQNHLQYEFWCNEDNPYACIYALTLVIILLYQSAHQSYDWTWTNSAETFRQYTLPIKPQNAFFYITYNFSSRVEEGLVFDLIWNGCCGGTRTHSCFRHGFYATSFSHCSLDYFFTQISGASSIVSTHLWLSITSINLARRYRVQSWI